jgi:hypothetical protein
MQKLVIKIQKAQTTLILKRALKEKAHGLENQSVKARV